MVFNASACEVSVVHPSSRTCCCLGANCRRCQTQPTYVKQTQSEDTAELREYLMNEVKQMSEYAGIFRVLAYELKVGWECFALVV